MPSILYIGGTGNLSAPCVEESLKQGWSVSVVNRGKRPVPEGVQQIVCDIRRPGSLAEALEGRRFDAAADFLTFNREQLRMTLDALKDRTGRYLFISTASAYKKPAGPYPLTEETPLGNPFWEYSAEKGRCEAYLAGQSEIPWTVVRPSHTYGPSWIPSPFGSDTWTPAGRILRGAPVISPGDGTSLWTLTHTRDFARAFAALAGCDAASGQAFHITSEEYMTWDRVYTLLGEALGTAPRIEHVPSEVVRRLNPERGASLLGDKAVSAVFDNSKIRTLLPGWRAEIPFREGIRESLAWYDARPDRKTEHPGTNREIDGILSAWERCLKALGTAGE